jgi:thiol-disulfide isomerase/thioredoxin
MGKVATPAVQAEVVRHLRERLQQTSEVETLRSFGTLWGLEFRSSAPQQFPELRKRVAADVERLAALDARIDAAFLGMLRDGAKQTANAELLKSIEDRIEREFPHSSQAFDLALERRKKVSKEPTDHSDKAAWDAWLKEELPVAKKWSEQYTEDDGVEVYYMLKAVDAGTVNPAEAIQFLEERLRRDISRQGESLELYFNMAKTLSQPLWAQAPEKAAVWMAKAWALAETDGRRSIEDDTLTDAEKQEAENGVMRRNAAGLAGRYLRSLLASGAKDVLPSVRQLVEGPEPAKKDDLSAYLYRRATLAAIDGRTADALTYYQAALLDREKPPSPRQGVVRDPLLAEAKAAFLKNGGSETTFALWSKPRTKTDKQELAQGSWEKPKKALPPFELADLSGKTWRLKQMEGKSVLINLWATWCVPCRAELPHLQKLYEKTKDRSDVQVITFNIDEQLGLVEPYMKENQYTFPVLMAYSFTSGLLDGISIPQNWILDTKGNWIATQLGFGASEGDDWVASMTKRLETAREGR